jgi:hypothetical protein
MTNRRRTVATLSVATVMIGMILVLALTDLDSLMDTGDRGAKVGGSARRPAPDQRRPPSAQAESRQGHPRNSVGAPPRETMSELDTLQKVASDLDARLVKCEGLPAFPAGGAQLLDCSVDDPVCHHIPTSDGEKSLLLLPDNRSTASIMIEGSGVLLVELIPSGSGGVDRCGTVRRVAEAGWKHIHAVDSLGEGFEDQSPLICGCHVHPFALDSEGRATVVLPDVPDCQLRAVALGHGPVSSWTAVPMGSDARVEIGLRPPVPSGGTGDCGPSSLRATEAITEAMATYLHVWLDARGRPDQADMMLQHVGAVGRDTASAD